jgi:hypothetical protein
MRELGRASFFVFVCGSVSLACAGTDGEHAATTTDAVDSVVHEKEWDWPASAWRVTCPDGHREIDTQEQLDGGLACVAGRFAKLSSQQLHHVYESPFSTLSGQDGWLDVRIKLIDRAGSKVVSVTYQDVFSHVVAGTLTAQLAPLDANGRFTAAAAGSNDYGDWFDKFKFEVKGKIAGDSVVIESAIAHRESWSGHGTQAHIVNKTWSDTPTALSGSLSSTPAD